MISFGFRDGFDKGFKEGTAFTRVTDTISRIETFLLAGAGAGTRGTETVAGITLAIEIVGTVGALRIVGITETIEAGAGTGVGIALGIEAFSSYARLNKDYVIKAIKGIESKLLNVPN
jgi:hypothetical protein